MIEDEQASTDIRARKNFAARIKEVTANALQSCHPKFHAAIALGPFWRLTISVNEEPENLMILPPLDDSLEDKIIIFTTARHPMPRPTATIEQREYFMDLLKAELPAFVDFLFRFPIPHKLSCQRYGITHYHHPEVLDALGALTPETRLLELIDTVLFDSPVASYFEGKAAELERILTKEGSPVRREAAQLLSFAAACGTYLARLEKVQPQRFQQEHKRTGTVWTIAPPGAEQSSVMA
jgi:hypothetical protein